ncbi:hypothetical protein RSAG8_10394, partial [Rhizoctonia solani AG-8 WAC10335]
MEGLWGFIEPTSPFAMLRNGHQARGWECFGFRGITVANMRV